MTEDLRLWYAQPARKWPDAMPIGNGSLGAMVFGQVQKERWQLNEDSVWYGCATDRNPKDALKYLPKLRQLLDEGSLTQAEELVETAFVAVPESQRHYEPLGLVNLIFPHREVDSSKYERTLDLASAISTVSYEIGTVRYSREVFASYPANVIAANLSASEPGNVTFRMRIHRQNAMPIHDMSPDAREMPPDGVDTNIYLDSIEVTQNCLVLKARTGGNGVNLCLAARVTVEGGSIEFIGETIVVTNANTAHIFLAAGTTYRTTDPQLASLDRLEEAEKIGYDRLREAHIKDYQSLFSRVDFKLDDQSNRQTAASTPTDKRVMQARTGRSDLPLIALYYQFGRYLLISSSRPGHKALPANLQGIWNEKMAPTWGSKFTINVNAEMNYWHAETTNLSECHEPFLNFLHQLQKNGEVTARKMYGCSGWVAHHNTDIWADTAPQDRVITATLWPMGGTWATTHIWHHFDFTGDVASLERGFEVLQGSVRFFLDFMIEKDGYMVTSPSLSPENRYRLPNGEEGAMCIAPTIDNQMLFQLFSDYLASVQALGKGDQEREMVENVKLSMQKLRPMRVGSLGQLLEWADEVEEVELGHRHFSHLWGLYPSNQITLEDSKLMDACKKTLERRTLHGGGHTGWSRAWMIALWARLGNGDEAGRQVYELLKTSTYDSLLDDHPPFQIDGNFGATAAITEMLVQSQNAEIAFLPALPSAWAEGTISGIRARGGFELSLRWVDGRMVKATVKSLLGNPCVIRAKQPFIVGIDGGAELVRSPAGEQARFESEVGVVYVLTFS